MVCPNRTEFCPHTELSQTPFCTNRPSGSRSSEAAVTVDSLVSVFPDAPSLANQYYIMPGRRGLFDTPPVEKTFCVVAAVRATTDTDEGPCASFLGWMDQYWTMFDAWDRSRTTDWSL
jgi:hypothetical protein